MQLFQLWRDSLSFFIPRNFKLFVLLGFNTFIRTFFVWFRFFLPLFIVGFISIFGIVGLISNVLIYVTLYLAIRPSVKRKSFFYFLSYWRHFLIFTMFMLPIEFCFVFMKVNSLITGPNINYFPYLFPIPNLSFFMLFYLDSKGGIGDFFKSFWSSLKMFWYGLPFLLGLSFLFWLPVMSMRSFYSSFFEILLNSVVKRFPVIAILLFAFIFFLSFLIDLVFISFMTNYYTKKVHDQFT